MQDWDINERHGQPWRVNGKHLLPTNLWKIASYIYCDDIIIGISLYKLFGLEEVTNTKNSVFIILMWLTKKGLLINMMSRFYKNRIYSNNCNSMISVNFRLALSVHNTRIIMTFIHNPNLVAMQMFNLKKLILAGRSFIFLENISVK